MQLGNNQKDLSYIPSDAYLYFPKSNKSAKNGSGQREFFDGNTQFDDKENQAIIEFRIYALKQNYTLKDMWTNNMILRFLYANNFKMSKTLESVKEHTIWRETKLPVIVDEPLQRILGSGLLYAHGRDHAFRPIVVFNVYMLDPKKVDVELITRALTFWFEYVINEWMLPGQIENWVFIADVKGMGVATLALQSIRKLFGYLQDNYKCRLHRLYVLNATPILYAPWQIIKKFLDEVTVQKIQICRGTTPTGILNYVNAEQLEEKYGGSAPNSAQYWPPVMTPNNYFVEDNDVKALISEEQYVALYNSGNLRNMQIDKSRVGQQESNSLQFKANPIELLCSSDSPYRIELIPVPENFENLDDSSCIADYLEYMSERSEYNQREIVGREFQSCFMANMLSH